MQSPITIQDFARDGRIGRNERAAYLKARERQLISLPPEPKPPTMYERFGARAISGTAALIEPSDGKRKLGSAYGADAGSARLNKALANPGKPKTKSRKKIEADLQAAMRDDMKVIRKNSRQRDNDALLPDTSPELLRARKKTEAAYRRAKPRKRRSPPRHRRSRS